MEDDDQQGLAHFAEHMAFNGTKDFPKNQLVDYLQKAGVRFGADLNAYTSFNETVYQLPLPTDDPALLSKGFTILANWAGHVSFDHDEIDKERGIIVEEDRLRGKDAGERMRKEVFPIVFQNSRYADRLPIGKIDIINTFKYETIKQFYKDWYRPELQAVVAVGDFDLNQVETLIKKNFNSLKNPKNARPRPVYNIPLNKESIAKVVTDPEFSYTVGYVFLKHPEGERKTGVDLKRMAMESMINKMFESRIEEIVEGGNAPFIHASGYYGPYYGGLGNINSFLITAVAKEPETFQQSITAVMNEVARVNQHGFTATELERAKLNYWADIERKFNEREKTSSSHYVQEYVQHFITGEPIPGIEYLYQFYKTALEEITTKEVNTLAKSITTTTNCTAILEGLQSNRDKLPDEKTYLKWIQEAGKDVAPYEDKVFDQPLLANAPAPGKIVSEKAMADVGATEFKLSNGITVILKPTDFKQDEIIFSATSTGGTSLSSDQDYHSASIATDLIRSSGIATLDKTQLSRFLTGKMLHVSPYIDEHHEGVWGSSTPKDIKTTFELIYLYLTQPRIDPNAFKVLKDNRKVNVAARSTFPRAAYQDTISTLMGGYHRRSTTPTLADIESLDMEAALRFYKERFADVSDFTFIFVGNFTIDEFKPFIETYLASIPALNTKESYRDLNIRPVKGQVTKSVYRGLEDKASVSLFLHDEYQFSEENNLMLNVLASALRIKLIERLREKESGVYSPRVNVSYGLIPTASYTFHIEFSCASANVERLITATREEIDLLKKEGVSPVDLEKFKVEEKRQLEIRSRDNNFWLYYLRDSFINDEAFDRMKRYPERLNALQVNQTKDAAQRFLSDSNIIRVVLLPEAAKAK